MVNNEHQALLPMRLRGLLHLMTFRIKFCIFWSGNCIFWWLLVSEHVFKPDAFCSRMFDQSIRRHIRSTAFWKWGRWRILKRGPTLIYQPLGLTSLPPDLLSSDSSPEMATKSRDWSSLASLFDGYECEIIGSPRPKAFFHFGRYPFLSRSKAF